MASTNKTVNYELSQFEGTDKPSWEADYNADMLSIDTNLKAVSDVADGASGSVSTLADRVTTAEGNISTNANDIDALEARADALESGETIADGRLDALEAEQLIQNTAIEGNTQLGYNLARPYDSASTYAVGAYVLFQNTLYKCTTAVTLGEAFDPSKWLAIKATDEIAAGGYTLPTASASTLGGVKVGSNLSIDQDGALSGSAPYVLPDASTSTKGGVLIGQGLSNTVTYPYDYNGALYVNNMMHTISGDVDLGEPTLYVGDSGTTSGGTLGSRSVYTQLGTIGNLALIHWRFSANFTLTNTGFNVYRLYLPITFSNNSIYEPDDFVPFPIHSIAYSMATNRQHIVYLEHARIIEENNEKKLYFFFRCETPTQTPYLTFNALFLFYRGGMLYENR